mgnify:CR=1 FL=1|tara:strand:- start:25767 stop:26411 length:645 start_codon:yes stop_codon:yes gene_type:complete
MKAPKAEYHPLEEKLNVISHGVGLVLAILGTGLLLFKAIPLHNVWAIVGSLVFGASMITLYAASTFYHRATQESQRRKLRVFDHSSIYVLIAGTYTPFTLVTLHGTIGWVLFGITWSLAIGGIVLKIFYTGRYNLLSTIMYVVMGWNIVFAIYPLMDAIGVAGFLWLLIGGIIYSVGAVLYLFDTIKYMHATFHLFVLLGTACHFVAIYFYVLS